MRKTLKTILVVAVLLVITAVMSATAFAGGGGNGPKTGNGPGSTNNGIGGLTTKPGGGANDSDTCHIAWWCGV